MWYVIVTKCFGGTSYETGKFGPFGRVEQAESLVEDLATDGNVLSATIEPEDEAKATDDS